MEQETLYTSSKWNILKALESGSKSPIDLAKEANTSLANVSQQLRLLELAGIVQSERIPNRDKGQPRIMYSLAANGSYLIVTARGFVDKKNLQLQQHQIDMIRIWFCEDTTLHYYMEKFYWIQEQRISKLRLLAFDHTDSQNIMVLVNEDLADKKQKEVRISGPDGEKTFTYKVVKSLTDNKEGKNTIIREIEEV